jgi:hypothetical protein
VWVQGTWVVLGGSGMCICVQGMVYVGKRNGMCSRNVNRSSKDVIDWALGSGGKGAVFRE